MLRFLIIRCEIGSIIRSDDRGCTSGNVGLRCGFTDQLLDWIRMQQPVVRFAIAVCRHEVCRRFQSSEISDRFDHPVGLDDRGYTSGNVGPRRGVRLRMLSRLSLHKVC